MIYINQVRERAAHRIFGVRVKTFSLHNFYTDPNYPAASNVYDSLGDAYMVSGDKILAIDNYEESLAPDPDSENAKQQLEALRGQE